MEWKSITHDGLPEIGKVVLIYNSYFKMPFFAYFKENKWHQYNGFGETEKDHILNGCNTIWAKREVEYWCEIPTYPDIEKQPYISEEMNKNYNL